ncbi:MAG: hypothetical protein AB1695_04180 [Stygiobacter sp.]
MSKKRSMAYLKSIPFFNLTHDFTLNHILDLILTLILDLILTLTLDLTQS